MDKKTIGQQIVERLIDKSFPSIVLLSGPWGSGKTHIAKTELIPELNALKMRSHYVSLYGLSDLNDFRDRVISGCEINWSRVLKWSSPVKNLTGVTTAALGDNGTALGVMNTLTQSSKHKLISKINNIAIIVDDLERASSDDLISEVLGECLNFAENNTNVWVIVIANEEHIRDKPLFEKTFMDKLYVTPSPKDLIRFVENKYPNLLCTSTKQHLKLVSEELKLTNYRVIQRILQRYACLISLIENKPEVDQVTAKKMLIDKVARICHAHYECGFSATELCGYMENSTRLYEKIVAQRANNKMQDETESSEDERQKTLERILRSALLRN
ncbi:KAP family NTPase [Vibrio coralliirubri]|uniref:KAP family NTPase n=1 Tax=Vibrio coralliirubri TaxID=1516159 RepID=UPI0021C30D80|nr:KAP family NTPase [Vibrio coralliirubri]